MAQGMNDSDLPTGPSRELTVALNALHARAGLPSRRKISNGIRRRHDLPDTVSHETVSLMLRGRGIPTWLKYDCVVRFLATLAVYPPDEQAPTEDELVAHFHTLWLAAVGNNRSEESLVGAGAPVTAPPPAPLAPTVLAEPLPTAVPAELPPPDLDDDLPPRNPRFVGREHQLREIHEVLRAGARFLTLNGMGGVGKTQLAVEYIYRYRDEYDVIGWIRAEHRPTMRTSLAALGARWQLPGGGSMENPVEQLLDSLERSKWHWLLVFDNAGPSALAHDIVPVSSGKILLTSRDPDWSQRGPTIEVGVFERTESVELLRLHANDISEPDAMRLAERLGDLPLAVEHAANWHVATGQLVGTYLDLLDRQIQTMLSQPRATAGVHPPTLAGFVTYAVRELARTAPEAGELLELFARLGSEPLSLSLLRRGRHADVSAPLRRALREEHSLNRAVRELRRHGLMTVFYGATVRIQVHRLFQGVLREWLTAEQLDRSRDNVRAVLAAANPGAPDDVQFWPHYKEVGPHIHLGDLATSDDFEVRRVILDQARYLFRIGQYAESRTLSERLVRAGEDADSAGVSDSDHSFNVLARQHLANALRMLGHYQDARRLTEDALQYVRRHPDVFGTDHEYEVNLYSTRALDLRIMGRYRDALEIDTENLVRRERVDPNDQVRIRIARNSIAVNHRLLGDFAEARRIDELVIQQWVRDKRGEDPRALFANTNLARDLYGLGRYREALNLLRRILPAYRSTVGDKHHGVLWAARTEVMALRKLGDTFAARALAVENHRDVAIWFGQQHEYTHAAAISLVNASLAVGDLGNATIQARSTLRGCEELFGPNHPMTLAMLVDSAAVQRALGDRQEAWRRDERAAAELRRQLGADHPYTLCADHNVAVDLALLGREGSAHDGFKSVLARSRQARGDQHPDTAICAVNLARARTNLGGQEAGQAMSSALAALESLLGPEHPYVLAAAGEEWIACDIEPPPT